MRPQGSREDCSGKEAVEGCTGGRERLVAEGLKGDIRAAGAWGAGEEAAGGFSSGAAKVVTDLRRCIRVLISVSCSLIRCSSYCIEVLEALSEPGWAREARRSWPI